MFQRAPSPFRQPKILIKAFEINDFPNDFDSAQIWSIRGSSVGVLGSIGGAVPNFERGDVDVCRSRVELQLRLAMCGAPKHNYHRVKLFHSSTSQNLRFS